ncbi:MAG: hypothetical protein GX161_11360 [Firmicutes bacterium]|jgi:endonuclease/exonuclease/phosphatase family metal-dependent hydrolase|nr:hypothetical protein [Bacillota bacterium]
MRIGTYNIFQFKGYPEEEAGQALGPLDNPARVEHFRRVFEKLDCDILALQEGGAPTHMLHELASSLGRHLATIPSPGKWPGQVLSRYPILESRTFSHFTWDVPVPPLSRCAGAVRVQLCDAHRMWVFVLHLHPSDGEIRKVEADIVCQCVEQLLREEDEMVILGDFNCERDEPVHVRLASLGFLNAMEAVGGGLRPTVDTAGKKIKRAIDHIYVSPHLADRLIAARVVDTLGFRHDEPRQPGTWDHSDHLPVIVDLR